MLSDTWAVDATFGEELAGVSPASHGPLASRASRRLLGPCHIQDSLEKGAVLLCGGQRAPEFGSHLCYQPTVIDRVSPDIPFGGMSGKKSGIGRIGGRHTLEEMSDLKTIVFDLS